MEADGAEAPVALRVDGGMVVNDWLLQFLADILGVQVERPVVTETTALGAAYLAGIKVGICGDPEEITDLWQWDARFEPRMEAAARDDLYRGWTEAVAQVRGES